ncbi:hypothetical protein BKA69DRAFT_512550 [Paraphysoderma sedebokerense]|nr:hypothetical protein BKA69DRAFT_512550 [Paraphysoderma sedebokerense]
MYTQLSRPISLVCSTSTPTSSIYKVPFKFTTAFLVVLMLAWITPTLQAPFEPIVVRSIPLSEFNSQSASGSLLSAALASSRVEDTASTRSDRSESGESSSSAGGSSTSSHDLTSDVVDSSSILITNPSISDINVRPLQKLKLQFTTVSSIDQKLYFKISVFKIIPRPPSSPSTSRSPSPSRSSANRKQNEPPKRTYKFSLLSPRRLNPSTVYEIEFTVPDVWMEGSYSLVLSSSPFSPFHDSRGVKVKGKKSSFRMNWVFDVQHAWDIKVDRTTPDRLPFPLSNPASDGTTQGSVNPARSGSAASMPSSKKEQQVTAKMSNLSPDVFRIIIDQQKSPREVCNICSNPSMLHYCRNFFENNSDKNGNPMTLGKLCSLAKLEILMQLLEGLYIGLDRLTLTLSTGDPDPDLLHNSHTYLLNHLPKLPSPKSPSQFKPLEIWTHPQLVQHYTDNLLDRLQKVHANMQKFWFDIGNVHSVIKKWENIQTEFKSRMATLNDDQSVNVNNNQDGNPDPDDANIDVEMEINVEQEPIPVDPNTPVSREPSIQTQLKRHLKVLLTLPNKETFKSTVFLNGEVPSTRVERIVGNGGGGGNCKHLDHFHSPHLNHVSSRTCFAVLLVWDL